MSKHPLVEAFRRPEVNSFASLSSAAADLSAEGILQLYTEQMRSAPKRGASKPYFQRSHNGVTTSGAKTNRREELLAIALWRKYRNSGFILPNGKTLYPVDYQFPLKARRSDPLGKIDLLCADSDGHACPAELKVQQNHRASISDTPLKALLEILAYAATIEPDLPSVNRESVEKREQIGRIITARRPNILVLAPSEYWDICDQQEERHPWKKALIELKHRIEDVLKIQLWFVQIDDCCWEGPGANPRLIGIPSFKWAF